MQLNFSPEFDFIELISTWYFLVGESHINNLHHDIMYIKLDFNDMKFFIVLNFTRTRFYQN